MAHSENSGRISGSFRDTSGFLFRHDGQLYRHIANSYRDDYDRLVNSGLYAQLTGQGLLVTHEEVASGELPASSAYKTIKPALIPFISYPYEWCFSQLKAAALLTLAIQRVALAYDMVLKDTSAYNIQFRHNQPVLIDTLSFEQYVEGRPWAAYGQFCRHFLAPLVLMSYRDERLGQLLKVHLDGIPLDLAASLLPARTRLSSSILMHLHLHAKSHSYYSGRKVNTGKLKINKNGLIGIIDQLEQAIQHLNWRPRHSGWADYYAETNYSAQAFEHKKTIVATFLNTLKPALVWDLGANTGIFSRIAASQGVDTISFDMDPAAVELNYLECVKTGEKLVFPLVMDLVNPSSGLGWGNRERYSLVERGPADTVMALALVHHLAIGNNVPFDMIAALFSKMGDSLIVEFVPKADSQVQLMLSCREDVFDDYDERSFEVAFAKYYTIEEKMPVADSERILYLMRKL